MQEELLALFEQMNISQQQQLLEKAHEILHLPRTYTGRELMALPPQEQERIVAQARSTQERQAVTLDPEADTQKKADQQG